MVQPENARMRFNEDTRQFELIRNAVMGKVLDVEASLDVILHNINNHQHEVNLVLKDLAPRVTDTTTAAELGITELVVQETSYFYGSEAARVQNIQVGSSTFDGILIAPGEVFSMAKYMTDISLDNGYAEAIIIVGDQSVKGVGGGICQVSTTLFRTAFFLEAILLLSATRTHIASVITNNKATVGQTPTWPVLTRAFICLSLT